MNGTVQSRTGIVYDFTSLSMPVDCRNKRGVTGRSKVLAKRRREEHGALPGSLVVESSVPDASPQGVGYARCSAGAIGAVRSNGIRHHPMLFDGITPPTHNRHISLSALSLFIVTILSFRGLCVNLHYDSR